jgi:hypothetical protein
MTRKKTMLVQLAVDLSKLQLDALADRVGVKSPPEEPVVRGMLHGLLAADLDGIVEDYRRRLEAHAWDVQERATKAVQLEEEADGPDN